jgi:DNA-binding NtrC family response regulator
MAVNQRPQLLVVDDEKSIRDFFTLLFNRYGCDVTTTEGVTETLRLLPEKQFDVAIVDLVLEDGDGMDLVGKIKAGYPDLPVIVITGLGFQEDLMQQAQALGAQGFVSKALPPAQVVMEVRHALRHKAAKLSQYNA